MTTRRLWVLVKGAIEDPSLDRSLSATGFTSSEEFQAELIEELGALLNLFFRANFEKPDRGWPDPLKITRPKEQVQKAKKKEKLKMASAAELVQFTESQRQA